MTEPDPIAALAAQLEELRGRLLRAEGGVGQVRARLETDSGQVLMLRLEIKKLGEKIEAAIARREADEPQAPYWLGLSREEHAARLAELRAWVERSPWSSTRVLRQAAALLAEPRRARARARQPDDGVGPDLRRPGQPAPAGRSLVPRTLAAGRPRPLRAVVPVRCQRLPPGETSPWERSPPRYS